jgi:sulfur-oxidizing protein SoxY
MIDSKRRIFLTSSLATSALGAAVAAGLLTPQTVFAAWPKSAFAAKEVPNALKGLYDSDTLEETTAIQIKAPDIAENGAVVPITIETSLADVTSIALIASVNPNPLAAEFQLTADSIPFVSTRIKMGKTGDVIAVVKAGGKMYSARKTVKVTIGGCGG